MSDVWNPGTVYLKIVPKIGERAFVSEHPCWNRSRFIEARTDEYAKEGGMVEVIDEQQYREARK